jgi:DNA-binding beta-propeller fold protein YncE
VEFVEAWGVQGNQPGQLNDPIGLAVDRIGRVYVANRGNESVIKFTIRGVPLLAFDHPTLRNASAVTLDSGGAIYAANARAGQMQIFFPQGDVLRSFQIAPQRNWAGPFAFSVDSNGKIFVPDADGGRVQVLNTRGRLESSWEIPSHSDGNAAAGLHGCPAITATSNTDDFVYVGDGCSGGITKYSVDGQAIENWGEKSRGAPQLISLAVSDKYVFAMRDQDPQLEIWSLHGQLRVTDSLGGQLRIPAPGNASLAVTPEGDLIVLDRHLARVLRFRIHPESF